MLPVTQAAAGWLLVLASVVVFALSFALRWLAQRRRDSEPVSKALVRLRNSFPARLLFGPGPAALDSDDIDHLTMVPLVMVAAGAFMAGTALVLADSFGVEFRLFAAP